MNTVASNWLSANAGMFNPADYETIKAKLENADDAAVARVTAVPLKKTSTAWLLAFFLGPFGSLYVGNLGGFFLRLFTFNGCCVLWFIDICGGIKNAARQANAAKILPVL